MPQRWRREARAWRGLRAALAVVLLTAMVSPAAAQSVAPTMAPPGTSPPDMPPSGQQQQSIRIGYLSRAERDDHPAAALPGRPDEGLQGARLGLEDNATTGKFIGQRFELKETVLAEGEDVAAAVRAFRDAGIAFIVTDLATADLDRAVAAPEAAETLMFNARAPDDRFRNADCRPFLLHTVPSRAMLTDALAQYLVRKRWTRWFLVTGKRPGDALYAQAVRGSAHKFGAKIVADKPWLGTFDARRTAVEEIPIFTQDVDYDVVIVADEADSFGKLFPYRTWEPRLVVGTQGLSAAGWHPELEQWGAAQLQSRFLRKAGRPMTSRDYAAWAAVRSIGEAAARTRAVERQAIADYLRGADFELAAFKGRKLSYRTWDGQLRQPIPLGWSDTVVSVSPQEGFLHASSELDTLGSDAPESGCHLR